MSIPMRVLLPSPQNKQPSGKGDLLGKKLRAFLTAAPLTNAVEDRRNGKIGWDWSDTQAAIIDAYHIKKAQKAQKKTYLSMEQEERIKERLAARFNAGDVEVYNRIDNRIDQIKFDKRLVAERAKFGFQWNGGMFGGAPGINGGSHGYSRPAFVFKGLASDKDPILALFVSKTHKAGYSTKRPRLKTGRHKNEVSSNTNKVNGLDDPEICWNGQMRGVIRVDVDADFHDVEDLLQRIAACGVPAPNLVVADGKRGFNHPHLYWLLHDSVCWTGRARLRPKQMFQTIEAALTFKLLPIGADPAGLLNPLRGKNPVSPLWCSFVVADAPYRLNRISHRVGRDPYGLPVLTEGLGIGYLKTGDQLVDNAWALRRRVCRHEDNDLDLGGSTTPKFESNQLFGLVRNRVSEVVRRSHPLSPTAPRRLAANAMAIEEALRRGCEREIEASVVSWADLSGVSIGQVREMAHNCFQLFWHSFDPSRLARDRRPLRGRLKGQCIGLDLAERQALGARDVASRRRAASVKALAAAYNRLTADGLTSPSIGQLAVAADVSRSTTYEIGMVAIKAAADKAKNTTPGLSKSARNSRLYATLPLFGAVSPERCLVKRESLTTPTHTQQPVVELNECDALSSHSFFHEGTRNQSFSFPAPHSNGLESYNPYLERQKMADERVKLAMMARKKRILVQTSFLNDTLTGMTGAPLYHYMAAQTPCSVRVKVFSFN